MKGSVAEAVVSATEVAVIVGASLGDAGTVAGGVYVTLVDVAPLSAPHVGEQAAPPAVSVHVTPLFEESFCTVAFTVTAADPAVILVIGLDIVTEIAGAGVTVIVSVAVADVSAADVAVTVAVVFAVTVAGALYVTLVAV